MPRMSGIQHFKVGNDAVFKRPYDFDMFRRLADHFFRFFADRGIAFDAAQRAYLIDKL